MRIIGQNSCHRLTRTMPSEFSSSQPPMATTTRPFTPPPTWRDRTKISAPIAMMTVGQIAQDLAGHREVEAIEHEHHAEERDRQPHQEPRRQGEPTVIRASG